MIKRLAAVLLLAGFSALAAAQLRTIPEDAKAGRIRHLQDMAVAIDGTVQRLAPGALIRDTDNRLILPVALPVDALVKYRFDAQGLVRQVWLLTPEEANAATPKPKPKPPAPAPAPAQN